MYSPVKAWRNQGNIQSLVGKTGSIVTWTLVYVPPTGFLDQAPYPVALVRLDRGDMITCQLVDCEHTDISIGKKVKLIVRRITKPDESGIIPYGIKGIFV